MISELTTFSETEIRERVKRSLWDLMWSLLIYITDKKFLWFHTLRLWVKVLMKFCMPNMVLNLWAKYVFRVKICKVRVKFN